MISSWRVERRWCEDEEREWRRVWRERRAERMVVENREKSEGEEEEELDEVEEDA